MNNNWYQCEWDEMISTMYWKDIEDPGKSRKKFFPYLCEFWWTWHCLLNTTNGWLSKFSVIRLIKPTLTPKYFLSDISSSGLSYRKDWIFLCFWSGNCKIHWLFWRIGKFTVSSERNFSSFTEIPDKTIFRISNFSLTFIIIRTTSASVARYPIFFKVVCCMCRQAPVVTISTYFTIHIKIV